MLRRTESATAGTSLSLSLSLFVICRAGGLVGRSLKLRILGRGVANCGSARGDFGVSANDGVMLVEGVFLDICTTGVAKDFTEF